MLKTLDDKSRGYFCLDCKNSDLFSGLSDVYRLYKPTDSSFKNYDFDDEIIFPCEISCCECGSENIGIELNSNEVITKNKFIREDGSFLAANRVLVNDYNFESILKIVFLNEDKDFSQELLDELKENDFSEWNWDIDEGIIALKPKAALVRFLSKGIIRQDEYGLMDEDSSYDSPTISYVW